MLAEETQFGFCPFSKQLETAKFLFQSLVSVSFPAVRRGCHMFWISTEPCHKRGDRVNVPRCE